MLIISVSLLGICKDLEAKWKLALSLYKTQTCCFNPKDEAMFIFGFARTMSFSLKLPERFGPIGFSPNKTQCALYAFDPESGESQQSWLSHIVKFWICLDLTLPGNPFKLKPEKGFAQILSQHALPRFPLLQPWSTFCAFASRADGNISWISHEGPRVKQSRCSPSSTFSPNTEAGGLCLSVLKYLPFLILGPSSKG